VTEADAVPGVPHPRDAPRLVGQEEAEAALLDAVSSGRLHHGWLLTGPRGVGKATLAYRAARALLASEAPDTLDVPSDHPVARRIRAGSEPRLAVLRREWDPAKERLPEIIGVDAVRALIARLSLSAADGGRRAVIVDAADDMNSQAANALLKLLEEPPDRTTLFLVAHRPAALLPTIRSRCRVLRLRPLGPAEMAEALGRDDAGALAALSGGSVGEALRLAEGDGAALYAEIVALLATMPGMDRAAALTLAEGAAGRGAEARRDLTARLLDTALARLALTGAAGPLPPAAPGEAEALARLAPGPGAGRLWAEAQAALGDRLRRGLGVNLDPATLLLDILRRIDETAARAVRPARSPSHDRSADAPA
jgi:DNA polymerase-3 subunit delta'